jgi:beta-glucosidase
MIVIIVSGRPLIISDDIAAWDAVIAAWLPGPEGAGVADVLFGKREFTGKLPLPWPKSIEQLPMRHDGLGSDGSQPLFPREYGLSASHE